MDLNPGSLSSGIHLRSTIQVQELAALLDLVPLRSPFERYREVVVDDNSLGKRGGFMRGEALRRLRATYRILPEEPGFRAFRWLWSLSSEARPLLALQRASENDALLEAALRSILPQREGSPMDLQDVVRETRPNLGESTAKLAAGKLLGSLRQAGFAAGTRPAVRATPLALPENAAYAVLFAYEQGFRGRALLDSPPLKLLDRGPEERGSLLRAGHARGWLNFRDAGEVVSIEPLTPLTDADA